MATDVQALLWGAGILALPLIMALPMRLAWQIWVGIGHEVSEYRTIVRQIVDSGIKFPHFRRPSMTLPVIYELVLRSSD